MQKQEHLYRGVILIFNANVVRKLPWCTGLLLVLATSVGCADDDADMVWDSGSQDDAGSEDAASPEPDASDADPPDASDSDAAVSEDAGTDAGADAGADAGTDAEVPLTLGGLTVNMSVDEQALDLFGETGHRIWVEVAREQQALLNLNEGGGFPGEEDIYTPGAPDLADTWADHVLIQDVTTDSVADYGKIEVALVGESTYRRWDSNHIPNLRFDADEFEHGKRIGGFEHLRLNNSLVGSIFREGIAHRIYRQLDYPALRSSHAFLGSSVWGEDIWVPMTLIEVYKLKFCKDNEELVGGRCNNMWEFAGDLGAGGGGGFPIDDRPIDPFGPVIDPFPRPGFPGGEANDEPSVPDYWCQINECDNTRLLELMTTLRATELGAGFEDALDPYIDWTRFHEFQCLSWIMWTGDDALHNSNNNMIMERDDGRLIWAPYSVDISAGQDWYTNVSLKGTSSLAQGCQSDPGCWADTITACEDMITRFDALDPETFVDDALVALTEHAMLRDGDQERAEALRTWLEWRQTVLAEELERFRYLPDADGNCPIEPPDLALCEDEACGTAEQCAERRCILGQDFCTSLDRCFDPKYEECPACEELTPSFCEWNQTCVENADACILACNESEGMEWCDVFQSCVFAGECGGFEF